MIVAVSTNQVELGLLAFVVGCVGIACILASRFDFAGWWVALSDPAVAKWEELADRTRYFDERTTQPLDWSTFPEFKELRELGRPLAPVSHDRRWAA